MIIYNRRPFPVNRAAGARTPAGGIDNCGI
jgi:hypothetical protein